MMRSLTLCWGCPRRVLSCARKALSNNLEKQSLLGIWICRKLLIWFRMTYCGLTLNAHLARWEACVRWAGSFSHEYKLECVVRQGWPLRLFNFYMEFPKPDGVCERYAVTFGLDNNVSKSELMVFKAVTKTHCAAANSLKSSFENSY